MPQLGMYFLYTIVGFISIYILYVAAKDQYETNYKNDLILDDNNQIIKGIVLPNSEVKHPRPQPTWYN